MQTYTYTSFVQLAFITNNDDSKDNETKRMTA